MKTFSKLGQHFKKHIDNIFFIFILLLLAALAVDVMDSDDTVRGLQELLGLNEKYDVLKFIGYCVAGVVSIWLAWAANKRANAMDATAKNTEAGQRQERLKNAIEHLGHDRDSVRMGGAYELFHLAKDTGDLRQTVMDILCAHIRQMTRGKDYQAEHKTKPSEEIQSLLTLLFTQEHDAFEDCSINLQGSYLNGANLSKTRLKNANLMEAQLQGAKLREAQLERAVLREAQLQRAELWEAQLQRAELWEAQLQGASLGGAKLQRADLMTAQLQGANLWWAQLQKADLSNAQLQEVDLGHAQMQRADLRHAQMQGAKLSAAQLQGAKLSAAQLQGAKLSKAQLQGADLSKVQLQGVNSQTDHIPSIWFENRIRDRIGKDSDLTGIIFSGGLELEDLDTLCEGLYDDQAQELRETLRPHVGKPVSHELPPNSGAIIGTYTQEEAERWISEYQAAMRKIPKRDDS